MSSYVQSRFQRRPREQRRVVVTGIGIVSPLGLTREETWSRILKGESGAAPITRFDASQFECQIAAEVKGFNPDLFIHKKEQKKMDLFIQYAMAATEEAIHHSGLSIDKLKSPRTGVIVSAGLGGLPDIEAQHSILLERGPGRISPFFIPMVIGNLASGQISIKYGAQGPNLCITTACATGAHSIGEAARYIRDGICDVVIAGGSESTVCPMAIGGFTAMRALTTRNSQPTLASRPFDKDRDGFLLGEGAAVLILEDYELAEMRGATILAEVTGYGLSSDAYHMTNPAPEGAGAARAMRMAIEDSGLNVKEIQYVNAHGTSTPVGDGLETQAIKNVFGEAAKNVAVSSTKSMTGHLLGAAGAIESAFCVLAIRDQILPPTINLENPSDDCDLDYVPMAARKAHVKSVLNNSFGFGGTNASLIFSQVIK